MNKKQKLKPKWLKLAGELLEQASHEFANHGCNDWNFPNNWTENERKEIVQAMHEDNGNPEEFDPEHLSVPDWWIMAFLAGRLKKG